MSTPDILPDLPDPLKSIWTSNGLPAPFLSNLRFRGNADLAVPSSFRLGLAAQISIGLAGLSAAYIHYLRTGITQSVTVDARHAVLSFHSEAYYTINDAPPGKLWDSIAGLYRTKDNSWVRIHTNFPHHRAGVLSVLGIPETPAKFTTKSQVTSSILTWDAQALEDACSRRGLCVVKLRSYSEWLGTGQGEALAQVPPVEIHRLGDGGGAKMTLRQNKGTSRPLSGFRVLDLSRVLAGPIAGRTLAAHGAQVLLITSPTLPSLPSLDVETSLGKRTTQLDLKDNTNGDRDKFGRLVRDADVVLQAYRPGGMEGLGFGVGDAIKLKAKEDGGVGVGEQEGEGVVYASLRAWGFEGPWADRRGFDSLVQTATGFNADEEDAYWTYLKSQNKNKNAAEKLEEGVNVEEEGEWKPRPFPMQAIDHASGYFLAFGINVALARRITEGGAYEVRVSLASVGQWIHSLGRLDPVHAFGSNTMPLPVMKWPLDEEIERLSVSWNERRMPSLEEGDVKKGDDGKEDGDKAEGKGKRKRRRRMTALKHAVLLDRTPVREGVVEGEDEWWGAPMRLDADSPVWL